MEKEAKQYIKPYKMFTGCLIPNWLLEMKNISDGAKLCYGRLCQYAGKDDLCYPKQETLAKDIGKSRYMVIIYLKELIDKGLIEKTRVGKRCSNRYRFLWHSAMVMLKKCNIIRCKSATSHVEEVQHPIERESYKENHILSKIKKPFIPSEGKNKHFDLQELEDNFGRIAKKEDIKAFLFKYAENTHRAIGSWLAVRYPADGWRIYSQAKYEVDRELQGIPTKTYQ